jgi:hypothetical protein
MAGSGDKAEDKERWFMEGFGVEGIFVPDNPIVARSKPPALNSLMGIAVGPGCACGSPTGKRLSAPVFL